LERLEQRKKRGFKEKKSLSIPQMSQEECLVKLRKCVAMAPIAGIQKKTLVNITKVDHQKFSQLCILILAFIVVIASSTKNKICISIGNAP
jgi:hypothetical protein